MMKSVVMCVFLLSGKELSYSIIFSSIVFHLILFDITAKLLIHVRYEILITFPVCLCCVYFNPKLYKGICGHIMRSYKTWWNCPSYSNMYLDIVHFPVLAYFRQLGTSTHFFFHRFSDTEFPNTIVCWALKVFPVKVTEWTVQLTCFVTVSANLRLV